MLLRGKPLGEAGERGQDTADKHRVRRQLCSREYPTTRSAESQMTGSEPSDPTKHSNPLDESQGKEFIYRSCLAVNLNLFSPTLHLCCVTFSEEGPPQEGAGEPGMYPRRQTGLDDHDRWLPLPASVSCQQGNSREDFKES